MAQQYKFSTADGKHSSFYNRQVPTFQLMSQATPFNNDMSKLSSRSSNARNVEDGPRYSSEDGNKSYQNDSSNPPNRPRHVNSKVRESQLSDILSHECARDTVPDYVNQESVDQAAFERAERASSIIGGQSAGSDAYRTTAQDYMLGETNQKKKISSKKMHYQNNVNVMTNISSAGTNNQHNGYDSNPIEIDVSSIEDPLIEKVRATLAKRGATGVLGMARLFRIMDDDDSKSLSMTEFKKAIRSSLLVLEDKELVYLFQLFDTDGSGFISYDEFIHIFRSPLNNRRKALVKLAFNIIDKDGSGTLEASDILDVYDVSRHPDFIAKKKSKDQILKEFLDAFVIGGMKPDGLISLKQFEDYYANIGACIESDDYFELMIRNAWHISGGEGQAANTANRRVLVTKSDGSQYVEEIKNDLGLKRGDTAGMMARLSAQGVSAVTAAGSGAAGDISTRQEFGRPSKGPGGRQPTAPVEAARSPYSRSSRGAVQSKLALEEDFALELLEALRGQLTCRGSKGLIGLQRQFRIMDDDCSKSLDQKEFKKAMADTHVRMKNPSDAEILFRLFDRDSSGSISYDEFLTTIRGKLSEKRKVLVNMAYDILDTDGSGQVDPADLVGVYDTSKHPDVLSKKKTSLEALRELLDCFDVGGARDGMVTRKEFENYYANVSASIDDDQYFELMIRNAWHISGGEGQAANTANRRVLVTKSDGSQYVEEIKNDLGLKRGDTAGMMARLSAQGVEGTGVSQYGGLDTRSPPSTIRSDATSIVSRLRIQAMANRTNRGPATFLPPPPVAPVTLMEIACAGPQGGDYGLPPSQAVAPPVFTASKKMFVGNKVFTAGDRLIDPQKLPHAGLGLMIGKLKAALKMRGAAGYVSLQRMFQSMDEDGDQTISIIELKNALKKLSLPAVEGDVRQIFDYFDRDSSGTIDFNEFMDGMRDPLSPKRLALVDMAFTELDSEGCGGVPFEVIASRYNVAMHPEVAAGRMTPKIAIADFLETFDGGVQVDGMVTREEFTTYYSNIGASIDSDEYFDLLLRGVWSLHGAARNISGGSEQPNTRGKASFRRTTAPPERKVTQVVATAPTYARPASSAAARPTVRGNSNGLGFSQQQQQQLQVAGQNKAITQAQSISPRGGTSFPPSNDTASKAAPYFSYSYGSEKPLSTGAAYAARVLGTRDNPAGKIPDNGLLHLIGRIKRDLVARGPIGFASLQRVFQTADINGDGTLSLAEFKSAIQSMQLDVKDSELRMLFQYFDSDDSTTINFDEFVKGLRDELGPIRLRIVLKAFKKLDIERNGTVDIGQLAREYNPSQHPDVLLGRLTAKQAMGVFLDTFDAGGEVAGRVTEKEFVNYYTNIGAIVDLDEDFVVLVSGVWGLESEEKKTPIIVTYDTRSCTNAPPSSLREALFEAKGQLMEPGPGSQYGPMSNYPTPRSQMQILNQSQVKEDVRNMQAQAVNKFALRNYSKACEIFTEALSVLHKILPPTHPDCLQIGKSIEACNKKLGIPL